MSYVHFCSAGSGAQRCTAQVRRTKLRLLLMGATASAHVDLHRKVSPLFASLAFLALLGRVSVPRRVSLLSPWIAWARRMREFQSSLVAINREVILILPSREILEMDFSPQGYLLFLVFLALWENLAERLLALVE